MRNLPKGYYAVTNRQDAQKLTVFKYKGVEYGVKYGKNLFSNVNDALIKAEDTPKKVLDGLCYTEFSSPVILFSAGEHVLDKFIPDKAVTLLGQNACVNPNIFAKTRTTAPKENPEREKNETVINGSFWWGKLYLSRCIENLVLDGFTFDLYRIKSEHHFGEKEFLSFKNIIVRKPSGSPIFELKNLDREGVPYREVEFINIRVKNFDGLDYANSLFDVTADKALYKGVCFDTTDKRFGFTNIARSESNCPLNSKGCEITVSDCFIKNTSGESSFCVSCEKGQKIDLKLNNSVFINASKPDESPIMLRLSKKSSFTATRCLFKETRNTEKAVAAICGDCKSITFENCHSAGFKEDFAYDLLSGIKAPAVLTPVKRKLDDKHTVIENADFKNLDKIYRGRTPSYGDLHAHSNCGGKSDGKTPIEDYTKIMDSLSIDFTTLVDHRQMRGYFLPTWDKNRFIYGMEPGTHIPWATAAAEGYDSVHYCMMFPNEYGLCMVFANFPEFGFKGDELTGFCKYPVFTKERFCELVSFINSIGGLIVHPHPKDLMSSKNPLDYCFGDNTYLETISVNSWCNMTYKNYELWDEILKLGKHVYTSGGADAHGQITNDAVSVFYTKEKNGLAFFKQMKSGDFTVGYMGIKMCIDLLPMGSQSKYKKDMTLYLKTGDFFKPHFKRGHVYNLRVLTDKGVAYSGVFDGKKPQRLALAVKRRKYYRADVYDLTAGHVVAISNPIWLDK